MQHNHRRFICNKLSSHCSVYLKVKNYVLKTGKYRFINSLELSSLRHFTEIGKLTDSRREQVSFDV